MEPWRRLRVAIGSVMAILVVGTTGYLLIGFSPLNALYQTVTTVTTVGYREVEPIEGGAKVFTIVLILVGVGTVLYTFTTLLQAVIEGELRLLLGRRRMERSIARMSGHVIICGAGRVGQAIAEYVTGAGEKVVVVEADPAVLVELPHAALLGDATDDQVLRDAGIERARVLVSALATDADNLFVTLSGRSLGPELFIVARARSVESEGKLARAGADRVVNPENIGGKRMAAFVLQPHVAEFLDVVMHDGRLEFRLEEVALPEESPLAGLSLRDAHIRDRTGAMILAMRDQAGQFITNPSPETVLLARHILIAIGTEAQLGALADSVRGR